MPYDITDAKDDIILLNDKVNAIIKLLKEKKLIEEDK